MLQKYKKKSNEREFKRRFITKEEAFYDLNKVLRPMFNAFSEACTLYESEIIKTPPESRARGFEASLLNSKMIQCIQKYFPKNWKFGKYKRFILQSNGYIVLFKKLDKNNKPMNIKTKLVSAISEQLTLPLFNDSNYQDDPILFFGYNRDKMGIISEPKMVYVDENKVKWVIEDENTDVSRPIDTSGISTNGASPTIKEEKLKNKKTS